MRLFLSIDPPAWLSSCDLTTLSLCMAPQMASLFHQVAPVLHGNPLTPLPTLKLPWPGSHEAGRNGDLKGSVIVYLDRRWCWGWWWEVTYYSSPHVVGVRAYLYVHSVGA